MNLKFIIRTTKKCQAPIAPYITNPKIDYFPTVYIYNSSNSIFNDCYKQDLGAIRSHISECIISEWTQIEVAKRSKLIFGSNQSITSIIFPTKKSFNSLITLVQQVLIEQNKILFSDKSEFSIFLFDIQFDIKQNECKLIKYSVYDIEKDTSYDTLLMQNYKGKRADLFQNGLTFAFISV